MCAEKRGISPNTDLITISSSIWSWIIPHSFSVYFLVATICRLKNWKQALLCFIEKQKAPLSLLLLCLFIYLFDFWGFLYRLPWPSWFFSGSTRCLVDTLRSQKRWSTDLKEEHLHNTLSPSVLAQSRRSAIVKESESNLDNFRVCQVAHSDNFRKLSLYKGLLFGCLEGFFKLRWGVVMSTNFSLRSQ